MIAAAYHRAARIDFRSVFKAPNRNNIYSILAAVCVVPSPCQHHKERRCVHFVGIDFGCHSFQALCAFFNQPVAAELDFGEAVAAVSQVNDCITFLPILISVMVNFTVQCVSKNPKIVVGTNYDTWEENLSLALKLHAQLETACPGITRPLQLRGQRFNEDLSPGALLIEVGAAGNSHDEALTAAGELAKAIIALAKGTQPLDEE